MTMIYEDSTCPACGQPIDYCLGHGEMGDPTGHAILVAHDDGRHERCHGDADCTTEAILDALGGTPLDWSWEWPGLVQITLDDTHHVATGLHGWAYGSVNVLADGCWEATDAVIDVPLTEHERDAEMVAQAWLDAVREWRTTTTGDRDDYAPRAHHHHYRTDISDWWCDDCATVTDYCTEGGA